VFEEVQMCVDVTPFDGWKMELLDGMGVSEDGGRKEL
jgi:hypothetical protein